MAGNPGAPKALWPETAVLGSIMLLFGLALPAGALLLRLTYPVIELDHKTGMGTIAVGHDRHSRSFPLSNVVSLELREVVQTGPDNGEDVFPRTVVQFHIVLRGAPTDRIPVVETLSQPAIHRFASEMADFLDVPLNDHSS